jgi:hypothetical protein
MAYIVNKYNGEELVVLQDGTLDTSTSIGLLGKNYVGYGEVQNENFVFLMENFAGINPPAKPITGQTWYDSTNKKLNAYDGTNWIAVGAAEVRETAPENPAVGALWLKSTTKQLYIFSADGWTLIGPEGDDRFGETRIKAVVLRDLSLINHIVLIAYVNGIAQSIIASETFTIHPLDLIAGFDDLVPGINMRNISFFAGNLKGNAETASRLETPRSINGVLFDGSSNITITSTTTGLLSRGSYLTGNNFNGSASTTWSVDATSENIIGKIVVRDSTGSFSAGEIIAEEFIGPLSGNVTVNYGQSTFEKIICGNIEGFTFSGTSAKAQQLDPGRQINGVFFDGTSDITVPAQAGTLLGNTLSANVVNTSITSLGLLTNLSVADTGITVGLSGQIRILVDSNRPTLAVTNGTGFRIKINDTNQAGGQADFEFVSSDTALSLGGDNDPAFIGDQSSTCNIGLPSRPFGKAYVDIMYGVATAAQYADLAENYQADDYYEPGTVLEFGGREEVTLAQDGTRRVAGVVTSNPAYLMNTKLSGEHVVAIALQGRVPCKVRGHIRKGDMLQAASGGYARPAQDPKIGTIIGKALEDFNGIEGRIEVAVGRL